jgi:lipopolysaccharide assembly outer membrane protein LptD (OstA)
MNNRFPKKKLDLFHNYSSYAQFLFRQIRDKNFKKLCVNKRDLFLFALFFLLFSNCVLRAENKNAMSVSTQTPVNITSDYLERNPEKNSIFAKGSVKIVHDSVTLTADEVEYFIEDRKVEAKGDVTVKELNQMIKGDELEYYFDKDQGIMKNSKAFYSPWILRARTQERLSKEKAVARSGYFTSCDYENPHYKFKAKKIVVRFGKSIVAYHVFVFIDGIPVFYFPILYQSLKDSKVEVEIIIGKNSTDGDIVKVKLGYRFTPQDKGTIYVDNYSKRGTGTGAQYDYKRDDRLKGFIYGYHIKDKITLKEQWNFKTEHWQRITPNLTSVVNINYQNNEAFNEIYRYNSNPTNLYSSDYIGDRRTSNIYSYMSAVYTRTKYSLISLWERQVTWDTTLNKFKTDNEVLPQFKFSTFKNPISNTIFYYQYILNLANSYSPIMDKYYWKGDSKISLTTKINIGRTITLTPTAGFAGTLDNEFTTSTSPVKHLIKDKYFSVLNLRKRLLRNLDLNFSHNYTTILYDNADTKLKKVEENILYGSVYITPLRRMTLTSGSSYDFNAISYENHEIIDNRQRLGPLVTELRYRPIRTLYLWARHDYDLYKEKTNTLQGSANVDVEDHWYIRETLKYAKPVSGELKKIDIINTMGIEFLKKWKFEMSLRSNYYTDLREFSNLKEQEYSVTRDLHCWESKFLVKIRELEPGHNEQEAWVFFSIKALPGQKIKLHNSSENNTWNIDSSN